MEKVKYGVLLIPESRAAQLFASNAKTIIGGHPLLECSEIDLGVLHSKLRHVHQSPEPIGEATNLWVQSQDIAGVIEVGEKGIPGFLPSNWPFPKGNRGEPVQP